MLKVSQLFHDLSYGELSNLSLAGEGDGTISPRTQPKIILHANDALLDLASRFVLSEKDILVTLLDDITNYHLIPRFAENYTPVNADDDEPIRYILDSPGERFEGGILRINQVFDSNGAKLPLNDTANLFSVFTPQTHILQVTTPVADTVLNVLYQARLPELTGELDQLIELPDVLHRPLRVFIAYKVLDAMNTQDTSRKAREHFTNYEVLCQKALDADLVNSSTSTSNSRFEKRGWA